MAEELINQPRVQHALGGLIGKRVEVMPTCGSGWRGTLAAVGEDYLRIGETEMIFVLLRNVNYIEELKEEKPNDRPDCFDSRCHL